MTAKKNDAIVRQEPDDQDNNPNSLLAMAIDKNASIETIEKFMALQERWEDRQAKKKFFAALSAFQSECPDIVKIRRVNYESKTDSGPVNYKFASLGDIDKIIKPLLLKHGLAKRWEIKDDDKIAGSIVVTCIVSHVAGHSETTFMSSKSDDTGKKNAIQAKGSAISYMKRYTLTGALGLTTSEEDNDALSADAGSKGNDTLIETMQKAVDTCQTLDELTVLWSSNRGHQKKKWFIDMIVKRRAELEPALSNEVVHAIVTTENGKQLDAVFNAYPDLHKSTKFLDAVKNQRLTFTQTGQTNLEMP